MGRYIARSDIENVFGVSNVAMWSNLENDSSAANDTRIDAAIAYAEQEIDDRFRGSRYLVPLSGGTAALSVVKNWAAAIAGVWLYTSRGVVAGDNGDPNRVLWHRRSAMEQMDAYLAGQRRLDCADAKSQTTDAPFAAG